MEFRVILSRRDIHGVYHATVIGPVHTAEQWARKAGNAFLRTEGRTTDVVNVCGIVTELTTGINIKEYS